MSQQNVETVRKFFAAVESNELAEALRLFDPDIEWRPTEGSYRGIDGVAQHWGEWMEPWDEHEMEVEELIGAGRDQVLVAIRVSARGEQSGMRIDQRFFHLYTVNEGKIIRMVEYVDRARAMQAAGLRE